MNFQLSIVRKSDIALDRIYSLKPIVEDSVRLIVEPHMATSLTSSYYFVLRFRKYKELQSLFHRNLFKNQEMNKQGIEWTQATQSHGLTVPPRNYKLLLQSWLSIQFEAATNSSYQ